jgi:hypothetical protein
MCGILAIMDEWLISLVGSLTALFGAGIGWVAAYHTQRRQERTQEEARVAAEEAVIISVLTARLWQMRMLARRLPESTEGPHAWTVDESEAWWRDLDDLIGPSWIEAEGIRTEAVREHLHRYLMGMYDCKDRADAREHHKHLCGKVELLLGAYRRGEPIT